MELNELLGLGADELNAHIQGLSDEDLSSLETELLALNDDLDVSTDEGIEALSAVVLAVESVRAETVRRETETAEREARAAELRQRIASPAEETETPAEVPAEAEPVAEVETETPAEEVPEPVAAAATRPAPGRITPRVIKKRAETRPNGPVIVAAGDVQGVSAGATMDSETLARAWASKFESLRYSKGGKVPVATIRNEWPDEVYLRADDPRGNQQKIEAVVAAMSGCHSIGELESLIASGGICAPPEVRYDLEVIAQDDRPVKGTLARFGAPRGSVSWFPAPTLSEVASGVAVWTHANDVTPASPTTKPCVRVDCGTLKNVKIDAVSLCIEIGNFDRMTFPEKFAAIWKLGRAQHARIAENKMLTEIGTATITKNVTDEANLGIFRDAIEVWNRTAAQARNFHRMSPTAPVVVMAPAWLRNAMAEDLRRQLPGDGVFAMGLAELDAALRNAALIPDWYWDSADGKSQIYGDQGDGAVPVQRWKATAVSYLFPPGTFGYIDAAELDLGVDIRDSGLIETNDVRGFLETFEHTADFGVWAREITHNVCIKGSTSGTVDIACPGTGS